MNYELTFFYKAIKSIGHLDAHAEGVFSDIKASSYVHRFEVRVICAVTPTCDCYELAIEDLRITLARSWPTPKKVTKTSSPPSTCWNN